MSQRLMNDVVPRVASKMLHEIVGIFDVRAYEVNRQYQAKRRYAVMMPVLTRLALSTEGDRPGDGR